MKNWFSRITLFSRKKRLPFSVEVNSIAADWDWPTSGNPNDPNPELVSITFVPGANDDQLVVRDGSLTGPIIFHALCLNTDEKVQYYYGGRKTPYIEMDDCTLNAGHKVLFDLVRSPENI